MYMEHFDLVLAEDPNLTPVCAILNGLYGEEVVEEGVVEREVKELISIIIN